jgi:hypothetical protein
VRYDPATLTPERMLQVVGEQGFTGKVVPDGNRTGPP